MIAVLTCDRENGILTFLALTSHSRFSNWSVYWLISQISNHWVSLGSQEHRDNSHNYNHIEFICRVFIGINQTLEHVPRIFQYDEANISSGDLVHWIQFGNILWRTDRRV